MILVRKVWFNLLNPSVIPFLSIIEMFTLTGSQSKN